MNIPNHPSGLVENVARCAGIGTYVQPASLEVNFMR